MAAFFPLTGLHISIFHLLLTGKPSLIAYSFSCSPKRLKLNVSGLNTETFKPETKIIQHFGFHFKTLAK